MPKVKKRITTEMIGDEEDEKDQQEDAEDLAIESAVMDFAEGERLVKLYRYPGDLGGRPRFLGGLAREDFNEVFIQERFGGGRFFGRWRKKNGQYTRFSFEIEGETKIITRAEEVRREDEEQGEPYPYLNRQTQQVGEDFQSSRIGMIDVLKMMAETRKESREEMRVMLEMMRPAQTAPDATEKVFSLVEKLAPLISQGGGEGGGNPWLFALAQLKEPLLKIVDTIQVAVTRGPAQAGNPNPMAPTPVVPSVSGKRLGPLPPSGGGSPVPDPEPTVEVVPATESDMIADSFKEYLPMLVKAASEKKDPDLYCDLVLDQVPRFAYDRLRAWLLKPGCLDALAVHAPIIAQDPMQRVWWEALRRLLIDAISEELGDAPHNLQLVPDSVAPGSSPADSA